MKVLRRYVDGLLAPIVKPLITAYDREWRILPRIREMESAEIELRTTNGLNYKRIRMLENRVDALEKILNIQAG